MNNLLPELHQGHAPITLHQLFRDALDAYDDWGVGAAEPMVSYEGEDVPISVVFDHMRACTDILPNNMLGAITERLTKPWTTDNPLDEMTFSTAARVMRILSRKRELRSAASDFDAPANVDALIRQMERRRGGRIAP